MHRALDENHELFKHRTVEPKGLDHRLAFFFRGLFRQQQIYRVARQTAHGEDNRCHDDKQHDTLQQASDNITLHPIRSFGN